MTTTYSEAIALHSELTGLISKAAVENRELSEGERNRVLEIQTKSAAIQAAAVDASEGRRAFLSGVEKSDRAEGLVLKSGDSFADVFKGNQPEELQNLSLGRYVRGIVTGDWAGAQMEMKAAMSSGAMSGGYLIPESLSTRVIDLARARSYVIQAGAVTIPMETPTMFMARVLTDPTAAWTAENATITESEATFGRIQFTANKLAALVRVSNELLEDASNVDALIEQSLSSAMALELDRSALFGDGVAKPTGIYVTAGIGSVTSVGTATSYDKYLDAIYTIRGANFEPNALLYSPRTAQTLAKMKSGIASDQTKLVPPADYLNLARYSTTQVSNTFGAGAESVAIMGQFNQYAIALRSGIRLEVSREADTAFSKSQTLIRILWRGDGLALQPTAFCKLTGITA